MEQQCAKVKNPCKFCLQGVTNKNGIQCMGACGKWAHFKCLSYTPGKISDIKAGLIKVTCPCPDCNTSQPKEFLKNPPYSCSNTECPANKLPKCDSTGCPANRKNVVSFPTPPSPEYKEPCSPTSCSQNSITSPASPNSRERSPGNERTCMDPPTPPSPPSCPSSCPPTPPCCPAKPRSYSPCPPCCPGPNNAPPCPANPPECPPPPPKCPPPAPKCPPPPPKCPPPPPKCPPPKCPPPKCPPPKCPPPKCPPPKCPPPKCPPPKCPSTPRCRTPSPPRNHPPSSKPKSPRCPPPRCPPSTQKPSCFPASPPTPPRLLQNYSATRRPNHSPQQQPTYVDVGTPMKSPSCSVLSYDVPDVSTSFEKSSSVVLMANNSDYSMNAYDEDVPQKEATLRATSATQIPEERGNKIFNSPSFDYQCSQTYISTSATQIAYDPEESIVSNLQKMNAAIDQLSYKIKTFMKKVEMREG